MPDTIGSLECERCGTPARLDPNVLRLLCSCGGLIRFHPGQVTRVADSITVPGAPALIADLIDRFGSDNRVVIEDAVQGYHEQAQATRPVVEEQLQEVATTNGGMMAGLENSLKQPESIRRKVQSRLLDQSGLMPGSAISDALRFTTVFPPETYTQGAQELIWQVQDTGDRVIDEENSWAPGDNYSALHYILSTTSGALYELQIHTPRSFLVKTSINHVRYEEYRSPGTSEVRRRELDMQMADEWAKVPIPDAVLGFGGPDAERRYET